MWIFDSQLFLPRSHCGPGWTENLIFLNQFSNFTIFLSYFSIPISLFVLWYRRRRDLPSSYIFVLFAHFIFFCGITHLNDVLAFFWPAYRFFTIVDFITCVFSSLTAVILPYTIYNLFQLPSFQRLVDLTDQLQAQILKTTLLNLDYQEYTRQLKRKVIELEHEMTSGQRLKNNLEKIKELKSMLSEGEFGV